MRVFLLYVLPLVAPTALYLLWRYAAARLRADENRAPETAFAKLPWVRLALAGVALLAAVLLSFAHFAGDVPGLRYSPARLIDGKIVPGVTGPETKQPEKENGPRNSGAGLPGMIGPSEHRP